MACPNQHIVPALEIIAHYVNENVVAGRSSVHLLFHGHLLTMVAHWHFPWRVFWGIAIPDIIDGMLSL